MLINFRNALMAGKRLPYDAEVEFLESTGTQYIDTGVRANQTTSARLLAALTEIGNDKTFFSVDNGTTYTGAFSLNTYNGFRFVRGTTSTREFQISANTIYDISCGPTGMDCNGVHYPIGATADFETVGTIPLCAWNRNGSVPLKSKCRIYAAKFYQNGVIVRDYIPVRKGTVGYLYDRVSGKLFGNAGTGDFVVGPDVVPVEYIASHGTEYINTGIYCDSNFYASNPSVEGRFMSTTTQSGDYYYGCATSWNNGFSFTSNFTYGNYQPSWGNTAPLIGNAHANDLITISHTPTSATVVSAGYGSITKSISGTIPTQYGDFWLFGVGNRNSTARAIRCYYMHILQNGTLIRNYNPIRVGTDATSWEGAMMDVLTRRIYRNAGTGAFGYGNDLKYPIPA